jgi:Fe2+ transport system protein FeoA
MPIKDSRDGIAINGRERPSHSKPRIAFTFEHEGVRHSAAFGRFNDGRLAEIQLDGSSDTPARLASMLLQRGVEVETIRHAVNGGPLAVALDRIMAITGGPRNAGYRWLQKCERRLTMNRRRTSQTWKHLAEDAEDEYVSNETFIAAAIALGFRVQWIRGTPNCWLNIAEPKKTKGYRR